VFQVQVDLRRFIPHFLWVAYDMYTPLFNLQKNRGSQPANLVLGQVRISHKLPEDIKLMRRSICTVCEYNKNGICTKCNLCGGRRIEYMTQLVFIGCPLPSPKWGAYVTT